MMIGPKTATKFKPQVSDANTFNNKRKPSQSIIKVPQNGAEHSKSDHKKKPNLYKTKASLEPPRIQNKTFEIGVTLRQVQKEVKETLDYVQTLNSDRSRPKSSRVRKQKSPFVKTHIIPLQPERRICKLDAPKKENVVEPMCKKEKVEILEKLILDEIPTKDDDSFNPQTLPQIETSISTPPGIDDLIISFQNLKIQDENLDQNRKELEKRLEELEISFEEKLAAKKEPPPIKEETDSLEYLDALNIVEESTSSEFVDATDENDEYTQDLQEVEDLTKEIKYACELAESMSAKALKDFTPIFKSTLSKLKLVVDLFQKKYNLETRILDTGNNEMVTKKFCEIISLNNFSKDIIILDNNFIIQEDEGEADEIEIDIYDEFKITDLRRIGPESIFLKWTKYREGDVFGYEVFVNECLKSRIFNPRRTAAILDQLYVKETLEIHVYAVGSEGRFQNPATTTYTML